MGQAIKPWMGHTIGVLAWVLVGVYALYGANFLLLAVSGFGPITFLPLALFLLGIAGILVWLAKKKKEVLALGVGCLILTVLGAISYSLGNQPLAVH